MTYGQAIPIFIPGHGMLDANDKFFHIMPFQYLLPNTKSSLTILPCQKRIIRILYYITKATQKIGKRNPCIKLYFNISTMLFLHEINFFILFI